MPYLPKQVRIQQVNIKELVELLMDAFEINEYVDIVVDENQNNIYLEPPETVKVKLIHIDDVRMTDELYRLLVKKRSNQ